MQELWFDVGIKRYTTQGGGISADEVLWFDVGIKRYTTCLNKHHHANGCGLM